MRAPFTYSNNITPIVDKKDSKGPGRASSAIE